MYVLIKWQLYNFSLYTTSIIIKNTLEELARDLGRHFIGENNNAVSVHAMKACRGCRGVAPLILNLGDRWRRVVS